MKTYSLGIDLGGTWMRACLADEKGCILKTARMPSRPWRELPENLELLKREWKMGKIWHLTIGAKGLGTLQNKEILKRKLKPFARRIQTLPDVEMALNAAFPDGRGILVIGGTGSIAFGRDFRGRTHISGGLGPYLGDEGSAFWIGREALKNPAFRKIFPPPVAWRIAHSEDPVRETAKLAAVVLKKASHFPPARKLRKQAAEELAKLVFDARRHLYFPKKIPVSGHGGLFDDETFSALFRKILISKDRRFNLQKPALSAARWAALKGAKIIA